MKKITTIVLVAQSVLIVLFLVYALVQRTSAIKNAERAQLNEQKAVDMAKLSEENVLRLRQIEDANMAHVVELEATNQQLRSELKKCQERR